jgi:putative membrane protein
MIPYTFSSDVYGIAVAMIVGYEVGIRLLAPRYCPEDEEPVTTTKRVLFYAGVLVLVIGLSWPIHDLGEERLFFFHMIEHLLVALVAPPLLLAGMPWWFLRALVAPILPLVKFLTKPLVALILFNAWLALLHVPGVVELQLTDELFHRFAHLMLFVTAIIMWWPVIDPIPDTQSLTPFGKMGYVFLQSLVPTIPASFMTLGSTPLYHIYTTFPRLWGISAMNDQVLAGLVMKIGGGLILWGVITWIFFSWWRDEQRYESPPVLVKTE